MLLASCIHPSIYPSLSKLQRTPQLLHSGLILRFRLTSILGTIDDRQPSTVNRQTSINANASACAISRPEPRLVASTLNQSPAAVCMRGSNRRLVVTHSRELSDLFPTSSPVRSPLGHPLQFNVSTLSIAPHSLSLAIRSPPYSLLASAQIPRPSTETCSSYFSRCARHLPGSHRPHFLRHLAQPHAVTPTGPALIFSFNYPTQGNHSTSFSVDLSS